MKKLNDDAWSGIEVNSIGKLDSSLKKNTAFAKKIRVSMNHENLKSTLKDIYGLSLEKYLSEILAAVTEGLLKVVKPEDIIATMEIVSALNQRFCSTFSPQLLVNILNVMARQQASPLPVAKQKSMLRLITELNLIGVFRTLSDLSSSDEVLSPFIVKNYAKLEKKQICVVVLRDLLNDDVMSGNTLPIAVGFLKRFQTVLYESEGTDMCTLSENTTTEIKHIFEIYTQANLKALIQTNEKLKTLEIKIKKTSIRTGKIPENLTMEKEQLDEKFSNMKSACQFFVEVIKRTSDGSELSMPDLSYDPKDEETDDSVVEVVKNKSGEDDSGVWESIETKNFYTRIPDLSDVGEKAVLSSPMMSSDGERMRDFISKLETVSTVSEIDNLAEEFLTSKLNNKASKNRIFKYFLETPEISRLKFFARFMAIHRKTLGELINELIEYVDKGFRTQIYNSNSRLNFKNIFFFCELIKFNLVPAHVIFHKIRALTLNISSTNNLDILSVFYEQCGRFLLYESEYKETMKEMITLLKEKRSNEQFSSNDKIAFNNLLVIVEPPVVNTKSNPFEEHVELSPYQQFLNHLIRFELNEENVKLIIQLIRKMDFETSIELRKTLETNLSLPELVNYDSLPYLAVVLHKLSFHRPTKWLNACVIDTVIEKIMRGLELTDYRLNRGRVAHVRYLAELYNTGSVDWKLIMNMLYKILNTGHANNQPVPMNYNVETDLPANYFRIQLCCVLLVSIKREAGLPKRKSTLRKNMKKVASEDLYQFMCYFEYYIFTKKQPIPIETEFKISDLIEKLYDGQYERATNINGAIVKLQSIIQKRNDNQVKNEEVEEEEEEYEEEEEDLEEILDEFDDEFDVGVEVDEEDDEEDDDDEDDDIDIDEEDDLDGDDEDDEEDDEDTQDSSSDSDSDSDSEDDVSDESDSEIPLSSEDQKLADELEKDFQKLVFDSYVLNKSNTGRGSSKFAVAIPSKKVIETASQSTAEQDSKHTPFTLITRKGKKTNATQVLLPDDSKLALTKKRGDEDEKIHRERIMQLVSNMD